MLKSFSKLTCLLILCFFVVVATGCNNTSGGGQYSSDTEAPVAATAPADTSFKFGVMADTQWTPWGMPDGVFTWGYDPEGTNQHSVAGSIISQLNQEFINNGVEFVIQVGDITDQGTDEGIAQRATYAQPLFDAGIGFFCMRGNHETYINFYHPTADPNGYGVPAMQANFPQQQGLGTNLFGATNFSSPSASADMAAELNGMSYAFDYDDGDGNSATFVIIDPWVTTLTDGPLDPVLYVAYGYPVADQQPWINDRLDAATRGTEHAFVFSHQLMMAGNHVDSPFGLLYANQDAQNEFFAELVANDVAFYIGGHDHMYHRSMVKSPDGLSEIEQVICQSDCPKFYHVNYDDAPWTDPATGIHQKTRQTPIATEFDTIGYYIYTVDGPLVTVEYYADDSGVLEDGNDWPDGSGTLITPTFNFALKDSFQFSLNGAAFMIPQGGGYAHVTDSYGGTSMRLGCKNTSTAVEDPDGEDVTPTTMKLTKKVTTGWKDQTVEVDSSILVLTGLKDVGATTTDPYLLIMSNGSAANSGTRIVTKDSDGNWVDAATQTQMGQSYVSGAPSTAYAAGSYGYNANTNEAWVMLDYDGTFAIKQFN